MNEKYDLMVYIGRFQPLHKAHCSIIKEALLMGKYTLVLVGSANSPRTIKNPFSYDDRYMMIKTSFYEQELYVEPLNDHLYDEGAWIDEVNQKINDKVNVLQTELSKKDISVCIIGCSKDDSSYYLKSFPQYKSITIPLIEGFNSTDIREDLYNSRLDKVEAKLFSTVNDIVQNIIFPIDNYVNVHEKLITDYLYIKEYKEQYKTLTYPPVFLTADALVVKDNKVLLVERKGYGAGLLALPGGYLDAKIDNSILDCMLRELREETNISLSDKDLKENIKRGKIYDGLNRTLRGRIITYVYHIELTHDVFVKGGDDAETADWYDIDELYPNMFFEDHYHIIKDLLKGLNDY